jgi:hypothetical protein
MATSVVSSITRMGKNEPFELQVARGQITMHSTVNIYGYGSAITTATIPAWENATAYTFPAAATTMNLVSTVNTGGDKTGTSILIQGLDSSYAVISETLTLNGTTAVVTTKSYLRINSISVSAITAGANPTGVITLKDLTNTTTYAQIAAGFGRSQMSIYTVPAGSTFYLSRIDAWTSANGSSADFATYSNTTYSPTGAAQFTQQAPFTGNYHSQRVMPRAFAEKTDIVLRFKMSANTYVCSVAAEGYLIANNGQS